MDRDDRSPEQVADLARDGVRVLSRRNLESYLFDDEALMALAEKHGNLDSQRNLLIEKSSILSRRSLGAADNIKPASGEIYVACRKILALTQCGNTVEAFMRDTLSPLVQSP